MKLPALLVSDLHFTDSADDSYRWDLFPQLVKEIKTHEVRTVAILGDLTDAKDYHSSTLVNRVVHGLTSLTEAGAEVRVLMGNHDYAKEGRPYFDFLNALPNVLYLSKNHEDLENEAPVLWLPHTRNPLLAWEGLRDLSWFSYCFMHQTVTGSQASNGQVMPGDGADATLFGLQGPLPVLWSGDIHVPQKIECSRGVVVSYVGSPYHVHYNDCFEPRAALLIDKRGQERDIPLSFLRRYTFNISALSDLRKHEVQKGDQVKVKMTLAESEAGSWPNIRNRLKQWAEDKQVLLADSTLIIEKQVKTLRGRRSLGAAARAPEDVVTDYVRDEDLGAEALDVATGIIKT